MLGEFGGDIFDSDVLRDGDGDRVKESTREIPWVLRGEGGSVTTVVSKGMCLSASITSANFPCASLLFAFARVRGPCAPSFTSEHAIEKSSTSCFSKTDNNSFTSNWMEGGIGGVFTRVGSSLGINVTRLSGVKGVSIASVAIMWYRGVIQVEIQVCFSSVASLVIVSLEV